MSIFSFPNQRIPERQKNEEWHREHIINYVKYAATPDYSKRKEEMLEAYYIAAAKLSPEKEKIVKAMITECYGANLGPKYEVYPLVETILEQLLGQYRERPLRRRAIVRNEEAVIKKLDAKVSMLAESMLREKNQEMESMLGFVPETENPDMQIPEDIEEFFEKDYRTASEETSESILHQILVVKKEKEKLITALRHYLISETAFLVLDEKDGHPSFFVPHPMDCFWDMDPMEDIQKDMNWFVYDKYPSINEIFNMFDLTEDQKRIVEDYHGVNTRESSRRHFEANSNWFRIKDNVIRPRIVSMFWVSRRKTLFKSLINKQTGREEYKILPPEYKPDKRDKEEGNIVSVEIDDIRHITMIGPDLVLSYGRLDSESQLRTIGNDKKRFIPAVGLIGQNTTGVGGIRSLAKKLEWLQDFASDILFELKLSLRYIDGNVMVYDLSNIPKEFMKGNHIEEALNKVKYHLKKDRMMLINSRDKRQNTYASSVNISQNKRLNDILVLLSTVEQMAQKISGVNENMQGQGNPYEKASVAEMRLVQASSRVENYFGLFDSFIDIACERLCIKGRHVYRENQVFNYFAGDGALRFLTIYPDFFLEDVGIYFDDNRKEYQKKRMIEQMATETFSRTQYPEMLLSLLKVFNADTSNDAETQLKKGLKAYQEIQEENQRRQEEAQQQANETQEAIAAQQAEIEDKKIQKDIVVANIYARGKQEEANTREESANIRKAAEIEAKLLEAGMSNLNNNTDG